MTKDATARNATDRIEADCDNIFAFLQAVALKSPQVQAAPLILRVYKHITGWLRQWADINLKRKELQDKAVPQDHSIIMGDLSEVSMQLWNAEALHPVVAAQREEDRETRSWYRLPPTSQRVILAVGAADGITITLAPPLSIHYFLNAHNTTALQAHCALT